MYIYIYTHDIYVLTFSKEHYGDDPPKKECGCLKVTFFNVEEVFSKIKPFIESRNAGFGSLV